MISRLPAPPLRPFVQQLWATDFSSAVPGAREHVLPNGAMHLVFRWSEQPLRLYRDDADQTGSTFGDAVIGGARSAFYVKDLSCSSCSVGAMLRPGAAQWLFGVPAHELAERHTPLSDLWGLQALDCQQRIFEARSAEARLAVFEKLLAQRLPRPHHLHPAVASALDRFALGSRPVHEVVRSSGYSHRHFIAMFRRAVGLPPKTWCRVQRMQRALVLANAKPITPWADLALQAGYSDQAHLSREFSALAGLAPQAYRLSAPVSQNHVAVGVRLQVNSVQDAMRAHG